MTAKCILVILLLANLKECVRKLISVQYLLHVPRLNFLHNYPCSLTFQMPEEDAFSVLVQIMQQYRMRDMFKPSMAELGLCMYQLENIVQEQIPELHLHFQSQVFGIRLAEMPISILIFFYLSFV